ncbi:MAG: hypothetical protein KJO07_03970 [Deltaproteobacteria bacterium]|nr:hypothetical protein [Deltaproteobacteria bacterium]
MKRRSLVLLLVLLAVVAAYVGHLTHDLTVAGPEMTDSVSMPLAEPVDVVDQPLAVPEARPELVTPDASEQPAEASPAGAAGETNADVRPPAGAPTISLDAMEVFDVAEKLVDECLENAAARNPAMKGKLTVKLRLDGGSNQAAYIAHATVVKSETTLNDPDLIECATENIFAAEEVLDVLRRKGDPTGGDIRATIRRQWPPAPKKPDDWPDDDSSPDCPAGTELAGERGKSQWCEKPDGTKHGDQYGWVDGKLSFIQDWDNGKSDSIQMRRASSAPE